MMILVDADEKVRERKRKLVGFYHKLTYSYR